VAAKQQTSTEALVIGGGLHGCSVALHLRLRGVAVTVVEKDAPGRHASGVNAGGVRRLNRDISEIPLSLASLDIWRDLPELIDDDGGFHATSQVRIAETYAEMKVLSDRVEHLRTLGYDHEELIDKHELRSLVPACASHCVGGVVCRADGFADPYRTTTAFFRAAQAKGVTFHIGEAVSALTRNGARWRVETPNRTIDADIIVNCAGAWADRVATMIGDSAPITPTALMMMVTAPMKPFLKPVIGMVGRKLSFKQAPNGSVVIGGGYRGVAHRDDNATTLDPAGMAASARTVVSAFPHMAHARLARAWAGIEAFTPDGIPIIGPSKASENVYHAFGFCGHGFQLGPAVGRTLAELIVTGRTNLSLDAFSIRRFDQNTSLDQDARLNQNNGA
jgi:sarcosine oxidase, subunit beta